MNQEKQLVVYLFAFLRFQANPVIPAITKIPPDAISHLLDSLPVLGKYFPKVSEYNEESFPLPILFKLPDPNFDEVK